MAGRVAAAGGRQSLVLGILCAAPFLGAMQFSIVNLVLPTMHRDLGLPEGDLQWVLSAYVLTYGACLLPAGRFGDLRSRRGALLAGMALFALGSLLCGLSGTEAQVIVSRALQGAGAAIFSPASLSLVTGIFPEGHARNRALGAYNALAAVGLGFGILSGGLLTELATWRSVFLASAAGSLACVLAIPLLVPADRSSSRMPWTSLDLPGAAAGVGALAALAFLLVELPHGAWPGVWLALTGACLLAALFLLAETRSPLPLVPPRVFRSRALVVTGVAALLYGAVVPAHQFVVMLYMQQVLGLSPLIAGFGLLPHVTTSTAAGTAASFVTRFIGVRWSFGAGLAIIGVGLALMSGLPTCGTYAHDVLPGSATTGVGVNLALVAMSIAATRGLPVCDHGLASGILLSFRQVGAGLGVALATAVGTAGVGAQTGAAIAAQLSSGLSTALRLDALLAILASLLVLTLMPGPLRPGGPQADPG